ncbi:MAG: guanylate kinase [Planctomycetota bacterium]
MTERGSHSDGGLVIISGPSGVGKSTLTNALLERLGDRARLSISHTTRPRRAGDRDGQHYTFVDRAAFEAGIAAGAFLEHAEVYGNFYGTPRGPVERWIDEGRVVVLEIDQVGATAVKEKLAGATGVFVLPPSEASLLDRLRTRGTDDEATIQRRYGRAKDEIAAAKSSGVYDHFVVNDDFDRALEELMGVVGEMAEGGGRRAEGSGV